MDQWLGYKPIQEQLNTSKDYLLQLLQNLSRPDSLKKIPELLLHESLRNYVTNVLLIAKIIGVSLLISLIMIGLYISTTTNYTLVT